MSLPINSNHSYLFIQQDLSGNIQWASNSNSNTNSLNFTDLQSWPIQLNKNNSSSLNVIILNDLILTDISNYFVIQSDNINIYSDYSNNSGIKIQIDNIQNYPGLIKNGSTSIDSSGNIVFNNDSYSNITIEHIGLYVIGNSSLDTTSNLESGWLGQAYWGYNSSTNTISNCYSTGVINNYCGGLLGSNSKAIISNCFTTGSVGNYAGGIVGANSNCVVSNSYSSGSIGNYAGGIVGTNCSGSITNCFSLGSIGLTHSNGIRGYLSTSTLLNNYIANSNWNRVNAVSSLNNTTIPTYDSSGNVLNPLGSVWATKSNSSSSPFVLSSFNLNTGYSQTTYSTVYGSGSNSSTPLIPNQTGNYSIINSLNLNNNITINQSTGVVNWTGTITSNSYDIYVYSATNNTFFYNIVSLELVVTKKPLIIRASTQTGTYGTSFILSQTAFTDVSGSLINSDTITSASIKYNGSINITSTLVVGTYQLDISNGIGSGLSNYDITYQTGILTINKKQLDITATTQTNTYGNSFQLNQNAFSSSGLVNSNLISSAIIKLNGAIDVSGNLVVGSYQLNISDASGTGLSNYNITYYTGTLNINKKPLLLSANAQSGTYGTSFALSQTAFTDSSGSLINSDTITSATIKYSNSTTIPSTLSAGTYTLGISNATGSGLSNYLITYATGILTINKYNLNELIITASTQSSTYGSTYNISQSAFTTSGLLNGDTLTSATIRFSGNNLTNVLTIPNTINVGTYSNALSISNVVGTKLSNYNITTFTYVSGNMVINQKELSISANTQSNTYGNSFQLNQNAFTTNGLVISNSDLVNTVSIKYQGSIDVSGNIQAGTYSNQLVITDASGSGLSNYNITYHNGTLIIDRKNLIITALDQSVMYKNTLNLNQTDYTVSGLVESSSDSVNSVSIKYNGLTTVPNTLISGTYILDITNAIGSGLSNYSISYVEGNLLVNMIISQYGNPNINNIRFTLKCLNMLEVNFKEILAICSITNSQSKISDLVLPNTESKIQKILTASKNIFDMAVSNYYSSYYLRVGSNDSNVVKFNILIKINIGQGVMRNTSIYEIVLSKIFSANPNGSVSVKSNSIIYANFSNSNFIAEIYNITSQITQSIEILEKFIN